MTKEKLRTGLLMCVGCFLSAAGVYCFTVAARVPVTGVAGISAILYHLWGLPMGLTNVLINVPIILLCYKLLGRPFFIRSALCMFMYAAFTDYLLPFIPVYEGDRLLATICGGAITAVGDSLIYMQNASTGGTDFVTMALKVKAPHLPLGNITFGVAVFIIALNFLVFGDVDSIIYGVIINFIASYIVNHMLFGFSSSMLALIVTDYGPEVCREIERVADRGSTILKAQGGWKQDDKDVVMCACSSKQLYEIEKAIKKLDPNSFTIMMQSNEVHGEGFRFLELGKDNNNRA